MGRRPVQRSAGPGKLGSRVKVQVDLRNQRRDVETSSLVTRRVRVEEAKLDRIVSEGCPQALVQI